MRHMRRRTISENMGNGDAIIPDRVFRRHGGLRFYVLWLLSGKEMTGSEIMDEIEKQTSGWWRPSSGSVYPLLKSLESDEMISRSDNGKFLITEKGREQISWIPAGEIHDVKHGYTGIREAIDQMEDITTFLDGNKTELSGYKGRLSDLRDRLNSLIGDVA